MREKQRQNGLHESITPQFRKILIAQDDQCLQPSIIIVIIIIKFFILGDPKKNEPTQSVIET